MLNFQQAGTGVKSPGNSNLSNEGIQETVVDGCVHADDNLKLRRFFFSHYRDETREKYSTSRRLPRDRGSADEMAAREGIKVNSGENKQFDPDG